MATPSPAALTFHKVREQCEQGNPEAWRAFLDFYTPVGMHLLKMYLPADSPSPEHVWQQALTALTANDFQLFRATEKKSEPEFLVDIRALLLEQALTASPSAPATVALDVNSLAKLLEGLPLLHQEMLFHKLAGYTDPSMERMLRMAPRVAQAAFARLEPDYSAALKIESDGCPWPRPWLALLSEARAKKQESCPRLHQFLRVDAGQASWYDKEPLEKHVSGCLRCLEAWAALREVIYWRKAAPAASAEQVERHLSALPLAPAPKQSLFRRMFH